LDERVYLELNLSKSVEENALGYVIEAEASNENLDFQEQIVLQRALLDSKEYFLKNGVLSWDHLHKRKDEKGALITDPEFIIGQPLSVEKRGAKTFVKAQLFKGNRIVEDLISKLKSGATIIKTSVGGMRPVISKAYDSKLGRSVEKVVSVLWDELALTYKPVNQTLSSVAFVKSLQLGYGTESAGMTGGRALVPQDLDGTKTKKAFQAVIAAITAGDVATPDQGRAFLMDGGVNDKEADEILEMVVNRRNQVKGVYTMDANLSKAFDEAVDELEKAMKGGDGAPMPPMPAPETPDPAMFEQNEEGEEEEEEEEAEGDEGEGYGDEEPQAPEVPVKKSREEFDDDTEFLDVSPVLESMSKSLKALAADNKALRAELADQRKLVKSIGAVQIQSATMLKSLSDQPEMRKSVITKQGRNFGAGDQPAATGMSKDEILRKSNMALNAGRMTLREASIIEDRLNKGLMPQPEVLEMLKSL